MTSSQDHLDSETRSLLQAAEQPTAVEVPTLTILAHPNPDRVGAQAALVDLREGLSARLSRRDPLFAHPGQGSPRPLADPFLSRSPILIRSDGDALVLDRTVTATSLEVDGTAVVKEHSVATAALGRGVILVIGDRVALLLHWRASPERPPDIQGLVGESPVMWELRGGAKITSRLGSLSSMRVIYDAWL